MGPGLFWNFPSKTSCTVSQTLLQTMYVVLLATVARRLFFFFSGIQSIPSFLSVRLLFHINSIDPTNVTSARVTLRRIHFQICVACKQPITAQHGATFIDSRLIVIDCLSCCFSLASQYKSSCKKNLRSPE